MKENIININIFSFFDGIDPSQYARGKGRGLFKKTTEEIETMKAKQTSKKLDRNKKKLMLSKRRSEALKIEISEIKLEQAKMIKIKELEQNLVNEPFLTESDGISEEN